MGAKRCWCCAFLLMLGCRRSLESKEDSARCVAPLESSAPRAPSVASACPRAPDPHPSYDHVDVVFPDAPGAPRIRAEHAESPAAKRRGLMYRTTLEPDAGMLFSWPRALPRKFWMQDTCISLDLLFLSEDNTIVGLIERTTPLDRTPRGVDCPAQRVLEVNGGWSRAHGVAPGQRVTLLR